MSNFNISRSKLIVTAALGLGVLGFSTLSAHADVTGRLSQCRSFTKGKVVNCCEQILRREKKPMWMLESHDNCKTAAVCVLKKYGITYVRKPTCYIQVKFPETHESTPPVQRRGR